MQISLKQKKVRGLELAQAARTVIQCVHRDESSTDTLASASLSFSRSLFSSSVFVQTCLYARVVCTSSRAEYEQSQQRLLSSAAHSDADAGGVFASCGVSVSLLRQWSVSRGRGAAACGNPQQQAQLKREMQAQQKTAAQQGQQKEGGKKRKAQNEADDGGAKR